MYNKRRIVRRTSRTHYVAEESSCLSPGSRALYRAKTPLGSKGESAAEGGTGAGDRRKLRGIKHRPFRERDPGAFRAVG